MSVSNYLQAVIWVHKLNGMTLPSVSSNLVHLTLLGIRRKSAPPAPKDPITIHHLKLMYNRIDLSKNVNVMFWACILTLFRSLLHVSHVVTSDHTLKRKDVHFPPTGGMLLIIRSSKTVLPGDEHVIPIAELSDPSLCPVFWVKKWLSLSKINMDQPLFSLVGSKFTYSKFHKALSILISSAWLRSNLSSHSFRQGGATFL